VAPAVNGRRRLRQMGLWSNDSGRRSKSAGVNFGRANLLHCSCRTRVLGSLLRNASGEAPSESAHKIVFVLTADADAQALIGAVLKRHRALRTRAITATVERFVGRDSGMVKDGPEIVRFLVRKDEYSRVILIWDHHGSGWEKRKPNVAVSRIQQRLNGVTWADNLAALVVVPELEEWLWHCPAALARFMGLNLTEFDSVTDPLAADLSGSREHCCREKPKELFEAILYRQKRRKPLPEDFAMFGSSAKVEQLCASATFARLIEILRSWFPAI
jgi:hypothetical protein